MAQVDGRAMTGVDNKTAESQLPECGEQGAESKGVVRIQALNR